MPDKFIVEHASVGAWSRGTVLTADDLKEVDRKRLLDLGAIRKATADDEPDEAAPPTPAEANSFPPGTSGEAPTVRDERAGQGGGPEAVEPLAVEPPTEDARAREAARAAEPRRENRGR